MPKIEVNTADAQEHVREIKRGIRFIKERCCGNWAIIPFKQIPKYFVIHLVHFCVMWINSFPAMQGISNILSSREIVLK